MEKKPRVINHLQELRQEYNLTQEQLAEDLGVTRHTILALEVGRYVPSIELALRLAAYFDQKLETIFWLDKDDIESVKAVRRKTHSGHIARGKKLVSEGSRKEL